MAEMTAEDRIDKALKATGPARRMRLIEEFRQAVEQEREECAAAICKHCAKLGIAEYDEYLRTWVHHAYDAVRCEAWPILARMRAAARGKEGK